MDNKDMPAMPLDNDSKIWMESSLKGGAIPDMCGSGLTKREYAAIHIMAAFAKPGSPDNDIAAKQAVRAADHLLKQLEGE